jgi:uncharacterized protein DUF726
MQSLVAGRWCSWCYKQTTHSLHEEASYAGLIRASHQCDSCAKPTATCRAPGCTNMARVEDARGDQFCATHGGAISSFEALSAKINDPTEMVPLLQRKDRNYVHGLSTAVAVTMATALALPLALVAAPAVGGAIGVGLLGLKGAAATSAGLAWLGFGSIASGGAGMFGGLALVTAVGGALGGTYGGVIANRYFSEVDGFTIEKVRDGKDPALICIDGFLTEGTDKTMDWLNGLGSAYEGHAVYRVQWEPKTLHNLSSFALNALGIGPGLSLGDRALSAITALAQSASKAAATKLGWLTGGVLPAAALAGNPWWVAVHKSPKTGVLIAETISRCEDRSFILIGHSLGARAVVSALHVLATREMSERSSRIRDVHLLGGAVDIGDAEQWRIATDAIEGKCYNYYTDTKNDWILTWLYRAANLGLSTPIGLSSLPTSDYTKEKLISIDCSHEVDGHSGYHASLGRILQVEKTKPVRRSFWSCLFGQKTASLQINTARSPALAARDSSTFR